MGGTIQYLNTDLDLTSGEDLTALAAAFKTGGMFALEVVQNDDGSWWARFETDQQFAEPEPNIAAMLAVVESLASPLRTVWSHCTTREFSIGYDCGDVPWAFNQALSSGLLSRLASAGASLRITLYPYPD